MADNVAITAGSGTTIATDDVSSVHYQKIKLVDGTADSSTAIPGGSDGLLAKLGATTANGVDIKMCSSADGSTALTNSAQAIKATAGQFYGYYIYNPNTVASYVQIYNVASGSVTVGTTNPAMMFAIPAFAVVHLFLPVGVYMSAAISTAATTTAGGITAPTTSLDAIFWYK